LNFPTKNINAAKNMNHLVAYIYGSSSI